MRSPSLENMLPLVLISDGVSFVTGSLAGIVGVVSKYALPKFGYTTVFGKPIATVSRIAFSTSVGFFSLFAVLTIPLLIVGAKMGGACCGGEDY